MKTTIALNMIALLTLAPCLALAEEPSAAALLEAEAAWQRGKEHFGRDQYDRAMAEFEKGYRLTGRGGFLFNMAECARLLRKGKVARELYMRYLAKYPTGQFRENALARCEALGEGSCKSEPPVFVPAPTPAPVQQPAAQPLGNPALPPPTRASGLAPRAVDITPVQPSARRSHRPFYRHWAFWTAVGVVVAGAATGVALAVKGRSGGRPDADLSTDARALGVLRW